MRLNVFCAVLVGTLIAPGAAVAQSTGHAGRQQRDGAKRAYNCAAPTAKNRATPPPLPTLSPQEKQVVDEQKPQLAANPDCPEGTVVAPITFPGSKGSPTLPTNADGNAPQTGATGPGGSAIARSKLRAANPQRRTNKRSRARLRRVFQFDNWYWYTTGSQYLPWQQGTYALSGLQSNEKPYIQYSNEREHSLSQLWGIDQTPGGVGSTQEFGWMVDFRMFGDLEPHLFVYHFDGGEPTGYSQDFVSVTNVIGPGSIVTHNDNFHNYRIQRDGTNWWFYYDGYWLGYLPQSAYPRYWNSGFTRIDAGGEMASSNGYTCGDIGTNPPLPGGDPNAAMWQQLFRTRGDNGVSEWAALNPYAPDPQYVLGFFTGTSFRYGGTGYC